MRKKLILVIGAVAILALALVFLLVSNRGVQLDETSRFKYTVQERSSCVKVVLHKQRAKEYVWTASADSGNPLGIKDKSSSRKGVYLVSPTEQAESGLVNFRLVNQENAFDCLYEITLSFSRDFDGQFVCTGYGSRGFADSISGGTEEGFPYSVTENPQGGLTVCFTGLSENAGRWVSSADSSVTLTGPEESDGVVYFRIAPIYENGDPLTGQFEARIASAGLSKELMLKFSVDRSGAFTVLNAAIGDAEIEATEDEQKAADYLELFGQPKVPEGAEVVTYFVNNHWLLEDETEVERKYGRLTFRLDGIRWDLYQSDELKEKEIVSEVKPLATASEACSVGSEAGTAYIGDGFHAVVWKDGTRVYLLICSGTSDSSTMAAMAQCLTK